LFHLVSPSSFKLFQTGGYQVDENLMLKPPHKIGIPANPRGAAPKNGGKNEKWRDYITT